MKTIPPLWRESKGGREDSDGEMEHTETDTVEIQTEE